MVRILLALDDFNELTSLQVLLKKVGFDVDGVQKNAAFEQAYLGLNPKVIVATAFGSNIDGVAIGKGIKRHEGWPKLILVTPSNKKIDLKAMRGVRVDYILRSPMNPFKLLKKIAQFTEVDYQMLKDKLNKFKGSLEGSDPSGILSIFELLEEDDDFDDGEIQEAGLEDVGNMATMDLELEKSKSKDLGSESVKREARFQKWIEQVKSKEDTKKHFNRSKISQYRKEIRESEGDVTDLDNSRKEFVQALFKKPKSDS